MMERSKQCSSRLRGEQLLEVVGGSGPIEKLFSTGSACSRQAERCMVAEKEEILS